MEKSRACIQDIVQHDTKNDMMIIILNTLGLKSSTSNTII